MALWLIARASGAHLPRRLVYVVDRRAVVDQATEFVVLLRKNLDTPEAADLKKALELGERSLPISTLRGQHVDNREWLEDPSATAIIVGTVDMVGSRLLFEGYGVSRKMRPYHAGLLGADALIVLDEAHLVPPFEQLLETIETCADQFSPRSEADRKIVPAFKLLSLSATGRERTGKVFRLQQSDIACDETARKRLSARKAITTVSADVDKLAETLADHAWQLSAEGASPVRCIVYCDERSVAKRTRTSIGRMAKTKADTELLVGARRVYEREEAVRKLRELGFIAGCEVVRTTPAFLVATSAGEVGVDLDADHMVCDLVAWQRMVQRLGRVNRRGNGEAKVIVVAAEPKRPTVDRPEPPKPIAGEPTKPEKPPKGAEKAAKDRYNKLNERYKVDKTEYESAKKKLEKAEAEYRERVRKFEETWAAVRLHEQRKRLLDELRDDASPGAIRELKLRACGETQHAKMLHMLLDAATSPPPLRPALTRAVLDAWSMTALDQHTGRPQVGPWLRGWTDDSPQTAVLWRKHLPWRARGARPTKKEIEAFFEAAPPHASELLETETSRVRDWLLGRARLLLPSGGQGSGGATVPPETETETEASRDELTESQTSEQVDAEELASNEAQQQWPIRAEDAVAFVLSSAGDLVRVMRHGDLTVTDKDAVNALKKDLDRRLANAVLALDARFAGFKDGLLNGDSHVAPRTSDDGAEWVPAPTFRFRTADADEPSTLDENWRERLRFAEALTDEGEVVRWVVIDKWHDASATEDDRAISRPQTLDEHESWTERKASRLANRLGLSEEFTEMLAFAARLHDEGKRLERWQRAFNAPRNAIYAKTRGPVNYSLLDGYRHEFGSLSRACVHEEFKDLPADLQQLALHLIAAHHGYARSVIPITGCEDAPPSALAERACDVALRFAHLQKRWGPWGLAWWESLLRAADQQASRDNDSGSLT